MNAPAKLSAPARDTYEDFLRHVARSGEVVHAKLLRQLLTESARADAALEMAESLAARVETLEVELGNLIHRLADEPARAVA